MATALETLAGLSVGAATADQFRRSVAAIVQVPPQYAQPTTGQTVTITNIYSHTLVVDPAGTLAALTIALPAIESPLVWDGKTIKIYFTQQITALTITHADGVTGAPATVAANSWIEVVYRATTPEWYVGLPYGTVRPPVITRYTSGSGTHTWTAGVKWARVRMVGAGGGGQGSGTTPGNGGTGGTTSFTVSSAWTCIGGTGGVTGVGGAGGTGGTAGTGTLVNRLNGTRGGDSRSGYTFTAGGPGGGTCFGQAAWNAESGGDSNASQLGPPNTGVGGPGGAADATAAPGAGGGGGEHVEFIVTAPTGTSAYAVGAAGTAGTIGTGTLPRAGSAGAAGLIIVEEFFT